MKRNAIAIILTLACIITVIACTTAKETASQEVKTETSVVKEEAPASTETPASGEEPASTEEPAPVEEEELNVNGVWQNDKTQESWIVIENLGQDWSLYNYLGEVAVKGNMYISGDYFDLRDENDETYIEIELIDARTIMDVTYQETYTKVPSLPDTFPGQSE